MLHLILESFLPLAVAMNVLGILPIFIGLTEGMSRHERRKLTVQALTTAFAIAFLILVAGQVIFRTLGITVNDLRVGGGLILLILSITDLIFGEMRQRQPNGSTGVSSVGIVPIGIPLVMGPAAITTIIVSQQSFGYIPTGISLVLNLALVMVVFFFGPALMDKLGQSTVKAVSKIASLFLTAIAVAMIRYGILGFIEGL
ncbi:MAG: MarC family protein [Rhodothermales bacterium]